MSGNIRYVNPVSVYLKLRVLHFQDDGLLFHRTTSDLEDQEIFCQVYHTLVEIVLFQGARHSPPSIPISGMLVALLDELPDEAKRGARGQMGAGLKPDVYS